MDLVSRVLGKCASPEALFVTELDRDGDGFVSSDELRKVLHKMGLEVTNAIAPQILPTTSCDCAYA